jgi:DNA-binding transcriptional ArsR family regulator
MKVVGQNSWRTLKIMSRRNFKTVNTPWQEQALIFAALGNEIRLVLVAKLFDGQLHSISQLTRGTKFTRQAITKHLLSLEEAKLVISVRSGRESLYKFAPESMDKIRKYLDYVSEQWDQALLRLKSFVEDNNE